MIAKISSSSLKGTVTAPGSKSTMQRACALALLNDGVTQIHNAGESNDEIAAMNIVRAAGADVQIKQDRVVIIRGTGVIKASRIVDCQESGLSLRMFTPILALSKHHVSISGSGSLLTRPVSLFDITFPVLNVTIKSNNGHLPLEIQGPLVPTDIHVDGSLSSQYLTGLLFSFAKAVVRPVIIHVANLKSKPYIDLSLQMLELFGYSIINENYQRFTVLPVQHESVDRIYNNEGDWSGASFLIVAGVISGEVNIQGLSSESLQADKAILKVLSLCGATFTFKDNMLRAGKTDLLTAFNFDATDCPDLFPPLVALAANCHGTSVIKGVSRLKAKESDRAKSLIDIFTKMGIEVSVNADKMMITGGRINGAVVDGHHDHRIVMAAAVAGLNAVDTIQINGADAIDKSYPAFFDHLQTLGASLILTG